MKQYDFLNFLSTGHFLYTVICIYIIGGKTLEIIKKQLADLHCYVLLSGLLVSAACELAVLSKWYAWSMLARRSDNVCTMWSINWIVLDKTAFHCCISVSCSCCCWSSSAAHSALVSGASSFLQFSNPISNQHCCTVNTYIKRSGAFYIDYQSIYMLHLHVWSMCWHDVAKTTLNIFCTFTYA